MQYLYLLSRSDRALFTVVLCSLYIMLDAKIDNLAAVHCVRVQYLYLLSRSDWALFTVVLCSLSIRLDTNIDNLAVVNCVRVCSIYTYCRGQIGHCSTWYYVHYLYSWTPRQTTWLLFTVLEYAVSMPTVEVRQGTVHRGIMFIIYTAGHQDRYPACCSLCQSIVSIPKVDVRYATVCCGIMFIIYTLVEYILSIPTVKVRQANVHCGIMFDIYTAGQQDRYAGCCSLCQSMQYPYLLSRSVCCGIIVHYL